MLWSSTVDQLLLWEYLCGAKRCILKLLMWRRLLSELEFVVFVDRQKLRLQIYVYGFCPVCSSAFLIFSVFWTMVFLTSSQQ